MSARRFVFVFSHLRVISVSVVMFEERQSSVIKPLLSFASNRCSGFMAAGRVTCNNQIERFISLITRPRLSFDYESS